jgi:hypothetical protein
VKQHHAPAQTVLTCQQQHEFNTHKLRLKTNIKLCRKAKKFIHVTHILYQTTDNHLFSWRYPELACKTKYICISKQENTNIFDISTRLKTFLYCACFSGDAPAKTCTRMSLILQSVKNFGRAE